MRLRSAFPIVLLIAGALACGHPSDPDHHHPVGEGGSGGDAGAGGTGGHDNEGGAGGTGGEEPATTGAIDVRILGLPNGTKADVRIFGPNVELKVEQSGVVDGLEPGTYVVAAASVVAENGLHLPVTPPVDVEVEVGRTAEVQVVYERGELHLQVTDTLVLGLGNASTIEVLVEGSMTGPAELRLAEAAPAGLVIQPLPLILEIGKRVELTVQSVTAESVALLHAPVELTFEAEREGLFAHASLTVELRPWVTSTEDEGPGSLRELAVALAGMPDAPALTFDPAVFSEPTTISLASAIEFEGDLRIEGPTAEGAPLVTLVASDDRVFSIGAGKVHLQDLALAGGRGVDGGCILARGELSLERVRIDFCRASGRGGAVAQLATDEGMGSLSIVDGWIADNEAPTDAAVYAEGTVELVRTTILGNDGSGLHLAPPADETAVTRIESCLLSGNDGDGIQSEGRVTVTVRDSSFEGHAGAGVRSSLGASWDIARTQFLSNGNGGLAFHEGTASVVLEDVTIRHNEAPSGAGLLVDEPGCVTRIESSELFGNVAKGGTGAGVYARGRIELVDTVILDNEGAARGGGIHVVGKDANLRVVRSTISGNEATVDGGGLLVEEAKMEIVNSTIAHNRATSGGGLALAGSEASVILCTISANEASSGGGIWAPEGGDARLQIGGSIVAANDAATGVDLFGEGNITDLGGNVIGVIDEAGLDEDRLGPGTVYGTAADPLAPELEPLGAYGGSTPTMRPLATSPAFERAVCETPDGEKVAEDQRGLPRTTDGRCWAGSVERQPNEGP